MNAVKLGKVRKKTLNYKDYPSTTQYEYHVTSVLECVTLLDMMLPFLGENKRDKAIAKINKITATRYWQNNIAPTIERRLEKYKKKKELKDEGQI